MRARIWILILFVLPHFRSEAGSKPVQTIPFHFSDGLIWVDVTISPSPEPFHFLLDSGANVSVIDTTVAKRIGAKLGNKVAVQGVQTEVVGYWRSRIKASAGGVLLPADYLALDLSELSGRCATRIDGLIGLDFFKRHGVIAFDFENSVLRFGNLPMNNSTNSVTLEARSCGLRVPITVNRRKDQWVRLDTGCASPLQWVAPEVSKNSCQGTKVAVGLSPILIPQAVTRVEIGPFSFDEIPTGVHSKPIFAGEAGLLGADFLRKFKSVTVDLSRRRLYFEPSMNDLQEKH